MKFEIKNRRTGSAIFEAEIDCSIDASDGVKIGLAVRAAVEKKADLSDADLRGADLSGADLSGADLSGADLRGADLRGAYLRGADLRDTYLRGCPVKIEGIHQAVYAAASKPDTLNMSDWHTCDTTHCRAGWVIHLAGDAGRALEWAMGTPAAAAVIYMASDPELERVPDFYCSDDEALEDMKRLAEAEAAKAEATP